MVKIVYVKVQCKSLSLSKPVFTLGTAQGSQSKELEGNVCVCVCVCLCVCVCVCVCGRTVLETLQVMGAVCVSLSVCLHCVCVSVFVFSCVHILQYWCTYIWTHVYICL